MDPSNAPLSDDLGGGAEAAGPGGGGATGGGGAVGAGGGFDIALVVAAGCLAVDACFVICDLLDDRFGAGAMALGGGRSVRISVVG